MLALVKTKPERGGVELLDGLLVPEPGPGEIRLRVGAAGLCGTDLHIYHWVSWTREKVPLPMILGHEVAGTVDRVGPGVTHVNEGDLVSLESHLSCGTCYPCRNGKLHLCSSTDYPGVTMPGGFAEWLVVPARIAWVHSKRLPIEVAAMFEPFGIAVHAVLEGSGVAGRDVVVSGCGPIGLMAVGAAKALGASTVVATDVNPLRLAMAHRFGADRVVDASKEDPVVAARELSGDRGADVVVECTGVEPALRSSLEALAPGGEMRLVGVPADPVPVDLAAWILKGITVRAIHGRKIFESWEQASRLVESGKIDLAPLVSHRFPLRRGLEAFEILERGAGVKVVIVPGEPA